MRTLLIAVFLVLPALAGCLQGEGADEGGEAAVAASLDEAGAVSGPAPAAPKTAYRVEASEESGDVTQTTAYPLPLRSNGAKEPVTIVKEGVFEPAQCSPMGNVDPTSTSWRWYDLSEGLETSDVFSYDMQLTFENTDAAWGEIHLHFGMGARNDYWSESTAEARGEVVQNFTGQSYRVDDDEPAWAAVACWYGFLTEPLEYTLSVTYTFAEAAVPAEVPVLVSVPEGATRLFVTGVPVDPSQGVNSHYRVFGPDDTLLCECALGSNEQADAFPLAQPGDYVVLVDHTANGFVSLALDAPPAQGLIPLGTVWESHPVARSEGGAVEETVEVELATVPLNMGMWYRAVDDAPASVGGGKQTRMSVENARGEVFRMAHAGFAMYRSETPAGWMQMWFGLPLPGEWDYYQDHHRFDNGLHTVSVQAEALRGEVYLWSRTYERV